MLGKLQIEETIEIYKPAAMVFAIIDDTSHLQHWAPAVDKVTQWDERGEHVGSVRKCEASLGGKTGTMVEKVLAREEGNALTYGVIEESFGMTRILNDYGFVLSVLPSANGSTTATIKTYYTPKNVFVRIMNSTMMRRQFRLVVRQLLLGLKRYCEK